MKFGVLSRADKTSFLPPSLCFLALYALSASAAVLSDPQSSDTTGSNYSPVSKPVSSAARWSLPFAGDLKPLTPALQATPASLKAPVPVNTSSAASAVHKAQPTSTAKPNAAANTTNLPRMQVMHIAAPTADSIPLKPAIPVSLNTAPAKPKLPASVNVPPAKSASIKVTTIKTGEAKPTELKSAEPENSKVITGQVSAWDGPINVDRIVTHLVDESYDKSPEGKKLDKQIKKLSGPVHKSMDATKDAVSATFTYQGMDPSARAGKLILDGKYKLRNIAWAEYERQKFIDKIHAQVVSSMMQVAEGLGIKDEARSSASIKSAKASLEALVGEDEAQRTITGLAAWLNRVKVPESTFDQAPWDTIERNKKLEAVLKTSLTNDPVVDKITKRLEKYANPGVVKNTTTKIITTTLESIALLAPGFAIPIGAEALNDGFIASMGGTELKKVERELLLEKRIQSRSKVLYAEAAMALDNYRYAQVTKNSPLLSFSEEVLSNMTGKDKVGQIICVSNTTGDAAIVPEIIESKVKSKNN